MTRPVKTLIRDQKGAAAIEFILAAPFLILLLVGILQMGIMFLAKAGLEQAVEAGARYATIFPRPSESDIRAKVLASGYGMQASSIDFPPLVYDNAGGSPYVEITLKYQVTPNFIFFQLAPIELQHTRRAYQV
jgi:Flp pilus assembly pilin Flp